MLFEMKLLNIDMYLVFVEKQQGKISMIIWGYF